MFPKAGFTFQEEYEVTSNNTARVLGSGDLDVLATPAVVAFMENAAKKLAAKDLDPEMTTVGISFHIDHRRASLPGANIIVRGQVTKSEERKIAFSFEAFDGDQLIATGEHERVAVNAARFLSKIQG